MGGILLNFFFRNILVIENILQDKPILHCFFIIIISSGATHSKLVICDKNGTIITNIVGPGTNHCVIGIPEVARRVAAMVEQGKTEANIDQTTKFRTLGLCLSGCEQVMHSTHRCSIERYFTVLISFCF